MKVLRNAMILFGTLVLCAGAVVMAAPEAKSWASQLPLPTTRARGCSSRESTRILTGEAGWRENSEDLPSMGLMSSLSGDPRRERPIRFGFARTDFEDRLGCWLFGAHATTIGLNAAQLRDAAP